jgi:hypothetical protein|tara:strand:+ start:4484 stop:4951 length:468 start_codon:yes stop_codon:yes gene_type:complete
MKHTKKAALTWQIIVPLILAVLIVVIILAISNPIFLQGWQASKYHSTEKRLNFCITYGESGKYPDTDLSEDKKKDGLPDFCDNCPLVHGKPIEEDGKISFSKEIDADKDLFIKGCKGNDGTGQPPSGTVKEEDDTNSKSQPKYEWKGSLPEKETT